jgi:hypothetical protein
MPHRKKKETFSGSVSKSLAIQDVFTRPQGFAWISRTRRLLAFFSAASLGDRVASANSRISCTWRIYSPILCTCLLAVKLELQLRLRFSLYKLPASSELSNIDHR